MTKLEAAKENCVRLADARRAKENQLSEEIRKSSASPAEKSNMLHTLSKLMTFSVDERDQLVRATSAGEMSYSRWVDK